MEGERILRTVLLKIRPGGDYPSLNAGVWGKLFNQGIGV